MDSPSSYPEDLTFPSLQVNRSLSPFVLDALAMRSHTGWHHEATPSSLEDSSYELLGESSFETSDDEGRTESLASTEEHTSDDVSSVADTEDFEDGDLDDASQNLPVPTTEVESYNPNLHYSTNTGHDSLMTSRADTHLGESSHIEIEETPSREHDELDGYGVIRQFESHEVPEILRLYNSPEVRISVKMSLAQNFLTVSRPFRIIYIGEVPLWAKDDINSHIAAALTAGSDAASLSSSRDSQSSRFSVVRIPSFPEGTPASKVQLVDSSGIELVVDQCTGARRVQKDGGKSFDIELTLNDGTLLTFGSGKSLQIQGGSNAPHLPDLAVFCHNTVLPITDTVTQLQEYNLVREAFKRHSIPSLDIAMVRPFHDCPKSFTFMPTTLRSCVEGRSDVNSNFKVLETLPIDIYSFLEVTPSQLNRHLALITKSRDDSCLDFTSITSISQLRELDTNHQKSAPWGLRNIFSTRTRKSDVPGWEDIPSWRGSTVKVKSATFWATILSLTAMVAIYLASSGLIPIQTFAGSVANIDTTSTIQISSYTQLPPPPTSARITTPSDLASPPPALAQSKTSSTDLTVASPEKSLAQPFGHLFSGSKNDNGKFDVNVIGEHRFALILPASITQRKRPPPLRVKVTCNSEDVPIRMSESANGVITVILEKDYPFGIFDVEVQTMSKPLLSQTFRVALGARWHTLFALNRNVERLSQNFKHDIMVAQSSLRNISTQLSKTIQTSLSRIEDGTVAALGQTKSWKQQVQKSTQSVASHLEEAKQEAVRRVSSGSQIPKQISDNIRRKWDTCTARTSEIIHSVPGAAMPDLWQQTAPLRTSPVLLNARGKALRLWGKVGGVKKIKESHCKKGRRRSKARKV